MGAKVDQTDKDREVKQLKKLFAASEITNFAEFARQHDIPGGKSMLSQHLKGVRPISLDSAVAYAMAFNRPLSDISLRLAQTVERLQEQVRAPTNMAQDPPAPYTNIKPLPSVDAHLIAEVMSLASRMNSRGLAQYIERGIALVADYPKAKANRVK